GDVTDVPRPPGWPAGGNVAGRDVRGVVAIYNGASVSDARRGGAGAAVTGAAIADARASGATWAILESSEMGRPVYERLGFRQVTQVAIYTATFSGAEAHGEPVG